MRPDLIEAPPAALKGLPTDHRGYVVPFFVEWIDGKPDFRVVDGRKLARCVHEKLCWLCGGPLAKTVAYVIGPMCAINRVSSEPPSHLACAEYACRVCPFLSMPNAKRREANMPTDGVWAPGLGLKRNPGVTLLWVTRDRLKPIHVDGSVGGRRGTLFDVGEPTQVAWYAEGRTATRAEVLASIESGIPSLAELADQQDAEQPGAGARSELERLTSRALALVPA